MSDVTQVCEKCPVVSIPDGRYAGKWSAYTVEFRVGGREFVATTKDGVRGVNVPCIVVVEGAKITIETS